MAQVPRAEVVAALRGQRMRVPDFNGVFQGWPRALNGNLEWLRLEVDVHLQRYVILA